MRAGIIALIKAELDEMLAGEEDEIADVSELLCTLQWFICWWDEEAEEGETVHPFVKEEDEAEMPAEELYEIGLSTTADIVKAVATADQADIETLRKSLGIDEEIATYKAALSEQEESINVLKAALDEIRGMAAPGGPVLRQTATQVFKSAEAERLEAEAARLRNLANQITDPALKSAYITKAVEVEANAKRVLNG